MAKYNQRSRTQQYIKRKQVYVVLNNKNQIWLKKPADKQVSASLLLTTPGCHLENPDYSSMPPKNTPPPLKTISAGPAIRFNKATVSTGGTGKITRATSSREGFSKAFVVVLQKASFRLKDSHGNV